MAGQLQALFNIRKSYKDKNGPIAHLKLQVALSKLRVNRNFILLLAA